MTKHILKAASIMLLFSAVAGCDRSDNNDNAQSVFDSLNARIATLEAETLQVKDDTSAAEPASACAPEIIRGGGSAADANTVDEHGFQDRLARLEELVKVPAFDPKRLRPSFQMFNAVVSFFRLEPNSRIVIDSPDEALARLLDEPMGWAQKLRHRV